MKKNLVLLLIVVLMTACGTTQTTNKQNEDEIKEEMTVEGSNEEYAGSGVSSNEPATNKPTEPVGSTDSSLDGTQEL